MDNMKNQLPKEKKVVISTTINMGDHEYVKKNRLMFSRLLENAISIHRTAIENGITEDYFNYLKNRMAIASKRIELLNSFIAEKGLTEELIEKFK